MTKTKTPELPIFSQHASEASAIATADRYQALKKRHEAKQRKFNLLKYLKIGGAIAVAAAAGAWYHSANETHTQNVTEIVQPHDMDWNVVTRAEKDAGVKLSGVDITPVVDKVAARYGTDLIPGQKIEVPIEKH